MKTYDKSQRNIVQKYTKMVEKLTENDRLKDDANRKNIMRVVERWITEGEPSKSHKNMGKVELE